MPDASGKFTKNQAGETVKFWRSIIKREKAVWDHKDLRREELRRITSELEYGNLLAADSDDEPIDQRDYHVLPRYVDRLVAAAGDEQPEVRFSRDMVGQDPRTQEEVTMATVGEIQDRAVMLAMANAGANEENEDAVRAACVDGIYAIWYEMTGIPSAAEALEARKSIQEVARDAAAGQHEPSRLQDHDEMAEGLLAAGNPEPEQAARQLATTEPGEAPFERVAVAGAAHLDELEAEGDDPLFWQGSGKFTLRGTRLPYGDWFLMDTTVQRHRDRRYMMRLLVWDLDDAREFEGFNKSVRESLASHKMDEEDALPGTTADMHMLSEEERTALEGKVALWHILDRKHGREYMISFEGVDEFLFDRPAPFLDQSGRSYLKAAGSYSGFFPVSVCVPRKGTRNDAQMNLGEPLLLRGLKGQRELIKLLSYYLNAVKQASSAWNFVHQDLYEKYEEEFRENKGAVLPIPTGADRDNQVMIQFGWKAPPHQLFEQTQAARSRLLDDLDWNDSDFLGRAVEDTASQTRMVAQGSFGRLREVVRQFEMSYAEQAHIVFSMMRTEFKPADWVELIGQADYAKLQKMWATVGIPNRLPKVRYAPEWRSRDFERTKQLLDAHERAKAEVDPLTGTPMYDTSYILEEALSSLGLGEPEKMQLSAEDKQMLMIAQAQAKIREDKAEAIALEKDRLQNAKGEKGGNSSAKSSKKKSSSSGKTRDSQGALRGRREKAGRRDTRSRRGRGVGAASGGTSGLVK